MELIVSQFTSYLSILGYGASTQRMLPACVRELLSYGQYSHVDAISASGIRDFYAWLQVRPLKRGDGGGLSSMMISHYVYALRVFFDWLEVSGQLLHNPMSGLKFGRGKAGVREPLSVEAVQQLFNCVEDLKEQALLHLFYSCGLRRGEAVSLHIRDVSVRSRLLYVRSGKGAKRRVIPLTAGVAASLGVYLSEIRLQEWGSSSAFMLNRLGRPMSGDSYNRLLKVLVDRAGLPGHVSPHYLRHSIATHLLQGGMHLEYVRDFLGHSHLEATQLYAKVHPKKLLV
ncbi:tyrosine-type recombinase/integrase [Chitinophaga pendula]|uniref:tyrosine-type recombinase/integrase n=1 Tax=Chitinophaga TaxID=79328 RepID=UPI000BB0A8A3|nr:MULTISPECIES: tyrosine-type recombinase/integrase [Chitinophaga]ASZ10852.1 hypothetical protein CK934_07610 [Chitinophaga sp. MD30]UCJ06166.1 tyrosine-type recombinase/integrase [Chitinophaga pendula]